ncbi:MAG TPA: hypothetical protein VFG87_10485 [Amycolatopsis sp.]|nr:hypothetical protein [Amycolatopsis sp.]
MDTNVFDTNVILLPARIAALGIDPAAASHRIGYTVGTVGFYTAPGSATGLIDSVDTPLSFDVAALGYRVRGGGAPAVTYSAQPGTALVVDRNPASAALDTVQGLLALEYHNGTGRRAGVIRTLGAFLPWRRGVSAVALPGFSPGPAQDQ